MDRTEQRSASECTHMCPKLPMHHRSPSVAGTVPTSFSDALDAPALLGAMISQQCVVILACSAAPLEAIQPIVRLLSALGHCA